MNDDNTDDDDNNDDNNDNENNDNNNNKNNKIDYLQAGTSTSNGKGVFKSMFRKKNIVNIVEPGSWEATTLKRCATSSSKRIGEKLKKKLSKKENFLILHKYFLQGNIMFYVTRF